MVTPFHELNEVLRVQASSLITLDVIRSVVVRADRFVFSTSVNHFSKFVYISLHVHLLPLVPPAHNLVSTVICLRVALSRKGYCKES